MHAQLPDTIRGNRHETVRFWWDRFLFSHVLLSPVIVSGSLPLCWWLSGDSSFQLITLICISVWLLWSWR